MLQPRRVPANGPVAWETTTLHRVATWGGARSTFFLVLETLGSSNLVRRAVAVISVASPASRLLGKVCALRESGPHEDHAQTVLTPKLSGIRHIQEPQGRIS
jgi:hypothetical protein